MELEINYSKIKDFMESANKLRKENVLEDVLRHNLSSWLSQIFPECPWWINEHISGTEKKVRYASNTGSNRGFVDSLVGKTVIEYEKNLLSSSVYKSGYGQVKDYCTALLNEKVEINDIIGILSDTVDWYAFKITNVTQPEKGCLFGRENIELEEIEHLTLDKADTVSAQKFVQFIIKFIGREGSRKLNAETLAGDMGFNSKFCREHLRKIDAIVKNAFEKDKAYAKLITTLWGNFVSYVGGTSIGNYFNIDSYINEFYIITLAKYLCVNILERKSIISDTVQSLKIMDGSYFREKGYVNLVEYDYFGWINNTPYVEGLLPMAEYIQTDLAAYDFSNIATEDLFGPLVAQLAKRDQRILLGQEYTPQWLAKEVVKNVLHELSDSEQTRFLDMCCGSGVFIVETLQQVIKKKSIMAQECTQSDINMLQQSIMGFDIDPLAVMLAKVNWILVMNDFVKYSQTDLVIPIFHADSLFMATPVTQNIHRDYDNSYLELTFCNKKILLPGFLLSPKNGGLFDLLIRESYSVAMTRAEANKTPMKQHYVNELILIMLRSTENIIKDDELEILQKFCFELITTLEKMQRDGQNGIWAYVLENSYRPALVAGRFNGIVSNPPWLAMSKLADNPYKYEMEKRANHYKIKPKGSSHLHTELSTIFLVQAVDYYLEKNSVFGCIVPDSILNGAHHDSFRRKLYSNAKPKVDLNVSEIWEVDTATFKNKAIVLFGDNRNPNAENTAIKGGYISKDTFEENQYRMIYQGKRNAWSKNLTDKQVRTVDYKIKFLQGADIMPRTMVFYDTIQQPNGKWTIVSIPQKNHNLSYLVAGAKKNKDFKLNAVNIDNCFIFRCITSNHLAPFYISEGANVLLPIERSENNEWKFVSEEEMILKGTSSLQAFKAILQEGNFTIEEYFEKLNWRNKLQPQLFNNKGWLVVHGAGGSNVCAGYTRLSNFPVDKLIVDQTLYWHIAKSEEEAIYITGLYNSETLDNLISEFQPEGLQGKRHVHKLPNAITPNYQADNIFHHNVVEKTKTLLDEWKNKFDLKEIENLMSSSTLAARRKKIRTQLKQLSSYDDYEKACLELYNS